jgi:hypothetical protein
MDESKGKFRQALTSSNAKRPLLGLQFNNAMLNDMTQMDNTNEMSQIDISAPQKEVEESVDLDAALQPKIELGQPFTSFDPNNSTRNTD